MNKKALYFALFYAALFIIHKLIILLGGYYTTRYGWFFAHIVGVFAIIPIYIIAIKSVRDKNNGGIISGKEAIRIALTIFAVSAVIISVYHYVEFQWKGKEIAVEYYKGNQFLDFLKSQSKIKPEEYTKIIEDQIKNTEVSAFKATTGRLFSMMIIGLSSAFICSVFLKGDKRAKLV